MRPLRKPAALLLALFAILHPATAQSQKVLKRGDTFHAAIMHDGRPLDAAFYVISGKERWVSLGIGEYGHPAIDTLTAGRLVLPDSITGTDGRRYRLKGVGRASLAHCSRLSEVVLPDSLTDIGDQAFVGCTGLRQVVLPPALYVIYPFAFRGCIRLNTIFCRCKERPRTYNDIFDEHTLQTTLLVVPAGTTSEYANSLVFGMFRYRMENYE